MAERPEQATAVRGDRVGEGGPLDRHRPGLYRPDDWMWRINRESVLLLAGPRALLMQLAHPLVAAGVGNHSEFRREPIARLRRTLDTMLSIIYGDAGEARGAADRVNRLHENVSGVLQPATKRFPVGTPYHALDPALLFWVQATLQDSALAAYECFVGALPADAREQQYQESKRMAPLLRLPESELPADYAAFRRRVDGMVEGDELEITPTALELVDAVLHPPVPFLPRFVGDLGSIVTVALLPPALRERYGFVWDAKRKNAWRAARWLIRSTLSRWPEAVRVMPRARRAERLLQEN